MSEKNFHNPSTSVSLEIIKKYFYKLLAFDRTFDEYCKLKVVLILKILYFYFLEFSCF